MKKKTKVLIITFLLFTISASVLLAQNQMALLQYFDYEPEVTVIDADGFEVSFLDFGMEIEPGSRIVTGDSTAEIQLEPNGTILKINAFSDFTLETIQARDGAEATSFALSSGKMRAVAARYDNSQYRFRTSSATGGVRGTDFGLEVIPGAIDSVFVREGGVFFQNTAGQQINVDAGQIADVFATVFEPIPLSFDELAGLFEDLDFTELDPLQVPGQPGASETTDADAGLADESDTAEDEGSDDGFNILEFLGLEIGSITIDGETYSKAVLEPKIETDGFKIQFYLPIIYTNNLFDRGDWYKPQGNDEWSFGTDQDPNNTWLIVSDIVRDLVLKIKFMQIGEQRDNFYLQLGNLDTMTLGHGILIRDYANDADFPSVRRLGINLGLDLEGFRLETLVNDLSNPEIFGLRTVFYPDNGPFGLGISFAADINPASVYDNAEDFSSLPSTVTTYGTPLINTDLMIFAAAIDMEVAIAESDIFSLIPFADFGIMMPVVTNAYGSYSTGLKTEALFYQNTLKSWGLETGVFGNVSSIDYRVQFQAQRGLFQTGYFDNPYDRTRSDRAAEIMEYLIDPAAAKWDRTTLGIYGELGGSIFDIFYLRGGYSWPWAIADDGSLSTDADDTFILDLVLNEDLLPLGIIAGFEYQRKRFRDLFYDSGLDYYLFDEYSTFKGFAGVDLADAIKLVVEVSQVIMRNGDGDILYNADGRPKMGPSVTIETRISF